MWYLIIILTCSPLIIYEVKDPFICLFAVSISSLARHVYRSFALFKIGLFISYCWNLSGFWIFYIQVSFWSEVKWSTQSCLTLCDPMDCSLPGSSVHWIFQARILEWVTISFSRGSSQPRDWTGVSCIAGRLLAVWATREVSF